MDVMMVLTETGGGRLDFSEATDMLCIYISVLFRRV